MTLIPDSVKLSQRFLKPTEYTYIYVGVVLILHNFRFVNFFFFNFLHYYSMKLCCFYHYFLFIAHFRTMVLGGSNTDNVYCRYYCPRTNQEMAILS